VEVDDRADADDMGVFDSEELSGGTCE
jgi:hypothetical protein